MNALQVHMYDTGMDQEESASDMTYDDTETFNEIQSSNNTPCAQVNDRA